MTVMDDLTKEQRHRAMSHIKATDTKIEKRHSVSKKLCFASGKA